MAQVEINDPIYRTTSERTVKMMVIMLGICIVGGGIFFGMWDYWISMPPAASNLGYKIGALPNIEKQSKLILSLPIYSELKDDQINYVIDTIKKFYELI